VVPLTQTEADVVEGAGVLEQIVFFADRQYVKCDDRKATAR